MINNGNVILDPQKFLHGDATGKPNYFKEYFDTTVSCTTTARTLDPTTYVAYHLGIVIDFDFPHGEQSESPYFDGHPTLVVNQLSNGNDKVSSFGSSGRYYSDGTNSYSYKDTYYMWIGLVASTIVSQIYIDRWIVCLSGSLSLPATDYNFRAKIMIPSNDEVWVGGSGGGFTPNVYYYYDTFAFDQDGNQTEHLSGFAGMTNATYYAKRFRA